VDTSQVFDGGKLLIQLALHTQVRLAVATLAAQHRDLVPLRRQILAERGKDLCRGRNVRRIKLVEEQDLHQIILVDEAGSEKISSRICRFYKGFSGGQPEGVAIDVGEQNIQRKQALGELVV
jgi:hypothetical protein